MASKKCLTYNEYKSVLENLKKITNVYSEGSTILYDLSIKSDSKLERNFYWAKFDIFETYPQFIGTVHETYGRDIDIRTYGNDGIVTMNIRGLRKELK